MDRNRFARQPDHAFDQVLLGVDREDKNNDIPTMGLTGLISEFIDKDIFTVLQGGSHAKAVHTDAGGNSVDPKIQDDSQNDSFQNVEEEALPVRRLLYNRFGLIL